MKVDIRVSILLLFYFLLFQSCKKFEWNNPFDPSCPKEIFSPSNLNVIIDGSSVRLSWSQSNTQISGFKIIKQIKGESGTNVIDVNTSALQYIDANVIGGKTYSYEMYAYAGDNNSNKLATEILVQFKPIVSTSAVVVTSASSVRVGGTITSDGGSTITSRGVCWSESQNPTIDNNKTIDGSGVGAFSSDITGLIPGTRYYVRSYATNAVGTTYGNEQSFLTVVVVLPTLSTSSVTGITGTTAISGGNVTSDGGGSISAKGIVWNTSPNPTVSLSSKTNNGSGTGTFTSNLTGLVPGTKYYVRAYATNQIGTNYGEEYSFTTSAPSLFTEGNGVTDIHGFKYKTVIINNQEWMAENLNVTKYRDGSNISNVPDLAQWANLTTGGYVNYFNDPAYADVYGKLYNYYAVVSSSNLCPTGWHIPSLDEWNTLEASLGTTDAGKKMKAVLGWAGANGGGNNLSGFSALPGGRRGSDNFNDISALGYFTSSTQYSTTSMNAIMLSRENDLIFKGIYSKVNGFSVRCLKD